MSKRFSKFVRVQVVPSGLTSYLYTGFKEPQLRRELGFIIKQNMLAQYKVHAMEAAGGFALPRIKKTHCAYYYCCIGIEKGGTYKWIASIDY